MSIKSSINYYCTHHYLATDRKEYIYSNIAKPYDIDISWIDQYKPECNFIKNHRMVFNVHAANKQFLNAAELSCYYKHYLAIRAISESQVDGIIFEDDIEAPQFKFDETLTYLHRLMINQGCDILFVGSFGDHDLDYKEPVIIMNESTKSRCAHCYIVRCNIANVLQQYLFEPQMPLDWQLSYAIQDLGLRSGWSWPHIYQRTEKNKLKSLLR